MSRRRNDLTPVRQSARRSMSAADRDASVSSTRTSRLASPDLIEQLTPPVAQPTRMLSSRAQPFSFSSISVKQEDSLSNAASRFFVREPSIDSHSASIASPTFPRSQLLRGAQFGLHDDETNASASIFSSSGSSQGTSNYQNEEQLASQLQAQAYEQTMNRRRTSGQRKARPSQDDLPYKPRSSDVDDDDDVGNLGLPRRRKSKTSWPNMRTGQDDNSIWMTAKRKTKRGTQMSNGIVPVEDPENDYSSSSEDVDGSGKETQWEPAPYDDHLIQTGEVRFLAEKAKSSPAVIIVTAQRMVETLAAAAQHIWQTARVLVSVLSNLHLRDLFLSALALLLLFSAARFARSPMRDLSPSTRYTDSDALDYPWSSPSAASQKEQRKLQAEIGRLSARLDSLSSQFDSQLADRMTDVEAKMKAENEARKEADIQRLMQSAKRQVSRLAQEELINIQNNVANSVELMLGQLNKKVDEQLKKRADATQDEFFSHLDKEIRKITQYANEEVNTRLKQSFDENYLSNLIGQSLETYSQDRTGKFDYASITSGAILDERGTVHRGYRFNSVWDLKTFFAQGRKVAIGDPVKAITPGANLGQDGCWMTGWDSMLQVNLSSTRVIDQVVLEHPLPGMARTAPRRVIVWGIVDDSDRQYYQQFRRLGGRDPASYVKELLPAPFYEAIPIEYRSVESMPLILSFFEFKANDSTLQTFNTTEEAQYYPHGIEATRWQFIDGWAQNPPICVHRVRLHGSHWPIFDSPNSP